MRMPYLCLPLLLLLSSPARAADLSVSCESPVGHRIERFTGKPTESSADGYRGVKPLFRLREGSTELLVSWGWSKGGAKVRDDEISVATVLDVSPTRIIALEKNRSEYWLFALYPKLGIGLFTRHSEPLEGAANASVFSSACSFSQAP